MTRFLVSDANADGFRLEDIRHAISNVVLHRSLKIAEDTRPESLSV
jgi:hypothetical protein